MKTYELLLSFLLVDLAFGFRFYGGEGGSGPDFLGEAGLNAVPRLGRRSLGSNPFGGGSRFRFRFNNGGGGWGGSRLAGRAGFRFQGDENGAGNGDRFMTLRKRMEKAIASDNSGKLKRQLEVGGPKNVVKDTEDLITEDLKALSFADKYWRDYLKDVATQNMMDKLSQLEAVQSELEAEVADARPTGSASFGTPLQNYLARSTGKMKQNTNGPIPDNIPVKSGSAGGGGSPLDKLNSAKYANFRPFVRANFKR